MQYAGILTETDTTSEDENSTMLSTTNESAGNGIYPLLVAGYLTMDIFVSAFGYSVSDKLLVDKLE